MDAIKIGSTVIVDAQDAPVVVREIGTRKGYQIIRYVDSEGRGRYEYVDQIVHVVAHHTA